ncbi:type IV pilus biogenesis complex ATPase subunit [Mycolicibacterium canariasense]|uniref:Type IV pilus biogenesis complex ATPase subunit n=1 Tax=Mycolicibacterium canariasense TaxID=228230 RepID=A0A100WI42_MYCCR|nr:hypothetical protein [Mycolicibacterium canariasense]MCV7211158.1 hypothetical protein [Mycolicibacterium canariasense]ORV09331.1 hypothetical protein AWB94_10115 [Mycolicibacterium canariasense]GAS98590.1 type IV pilus biogenesis complex ATPase subunit [Mycolicibacterium canariasense]
MTVSATRYDLPQMKREEHSTVDADIVKDREFMMVAASLERLAIRVESRFNSDMTESADDPVAGVELVNYARACLSVLEDPAVSARLLAASPHRW